MIDFWNRQSLSGQSTATLKRVIIRRRRGGSQAMVENAAILVEGRRELHIKVGGCWFDATHYPDEDFGRPQPGVGDARKERAVGGWFIDRSTPGGPPHGLALHVIQKSVHSHEISILGIQLIHIFRIVLKTLS
jgi:hypothetical protein